MQTRRPELRTYNGRTETYRVLTGAGWMLVALDEALEYVKHDIGETTYCYPGDIVDSMWGAIDHVQEEGLL